MPRLSTAIAVFIALLLSWGGPAWSHQPFTTAQTADIDRLIHDYILAHPDVVVAALQAAQDKEDAEKQANAETALSTYRDQLLHDPASPVLGNPHGDVTLVEFFDYRCPYCKSSAPNVTALIQSDPKLRVVMKEFPVLGADSVFASKVALVAARYDKYQAFHDAVLANKGSLDDGKTLAIARSVGLDSDAVSKQMSDPAIETNLQKNLALAQILQIDGTPTFIVGDTIIPGMATIDDLKQAIAQARGKS